VIWSSKSPSQFLGLGLKIKQASVYQLHHKTDGGRTAQDTRRDLPACFTWKQVALGFLQSDLKTGEDATASDARGTIAEVALGSS
jgi:hypothetical protein